ncbi:winged helix-turn-helix transcriptional regulator [Arthrobacter silvisoli]|uniref:winged helix-turn-helix transcriptional regulator n=1 Tax=Arthrobacter silvisoli TaxID=2291022 RepID=UPI000E2198B2|nr:helix-turn-helix domain-containing protein [Arthrobacter silvisoli]
MPLRSDWSARTCSLARGLDVLGDPWGSLVLREIFFGNGRFDAIKQRLDIADTVLSKRLGWLLEAGLLARRPYQDGSRTRQEYVLTPKGEDALPVLNAIIIWAEKHLDAPDEVSHMRVIHTGCGQPTSSADTCSHCGVPLTAANSSWHSLKRSEQPLPLAVAPVEIGPAAAPAAPAPDKGSTPETEIPA